MTNLEIAKDQLGLALQEIKNTLTVEQGELIHDYVFEALKQVKNCSIPVVVGRSEQLVCECPAHTYYEWEKEQNKCCECGRPLYAN